MCFQWPHEFISSGGSFLVELSLCPLCFSLFFLSVLREIQCSRRFPKLNESKLYFSFHFCSSYISFFPSSYNFFIYQSLFLSLFARPLSLSWFFFPPISSSHFDSPLIFFFSNLFSPPISLLPNFFTLIFLSSSTALKSVLTLFILFISLFPYFFCFRLLSLNTTLSTNISSSFDPPRFSLGSIFSLLSHFIIIFIQFSLPSFHATFFAQLIFSIFPFLFLFFFSH